VSGQNLHARREESRRMGRNVPPNQGIEISHILLGASKLKY
jgi:hypothetical protein